MIYNFLKTKFTALLLTIAFFIPTCSVGAEETQNSCCILPIEEEILSESELTKIPLESGCDHKRNSYEKSSSASNVYVSQLSSEEKELYDRICAEYEYLYNSSANAENQRFVKLSYDSTAISRDSLKKVYYIFYYTNPEYFFAYNGYSIGNSDGSSFIALKIYTEFMSAETRCEVRDGIETKAAEWLSEINTLDSELEKELFITEKICETIDYNESSPLNQSLAGAMYYGECVCNGYAMAVNYMCNLSGMETFTILSRNHAWNAVNLYGTFFCLDTTWADINANSSQWINKSAQTLRRQDLSGSHKIDLSPFGDINIPDMPADDTDDTVNITKEIFPDEALRKELSAMLDSDSSGGLCLNEYAFGENIDLSGKNIGDLAGIASLPSLRYLNCSYNPLFYADMNDTRLSDESFVCSGNIVSVISSEIHMPDDFDFAKASGWIGGQPDEKNRLLIAESCKVSYNYDCGNGINRTFILRICRADDPISCIAEGISFGFAEGYYTDEIEARIRSGESLFKITAEYSNELWKQDSSSFAEALYFSLLERFPDKEGKAHWDNKINIGASKEYIIRGFLDSDEFRNRISMTSCSFALYPNDISAVSISKEEFISSVYRGFLRRYPKQNEINLWTDIPNEDIVLNVICSEEYARHPLSDSEFINTLYIILLQRNPDPDGFLHWQSCLADNSSSITVQRFLMSEEWKKLNTR